MPTSLAYWRPLAYQGHADAVDSLAVVKRFVLEKRLPPMKWVEERSEMKVPWRERSLGKELEKLSRGDYVLVKRLIYLGSTIDECCDIMSFLAERQIFFYDLNSKCHIEREEQFLHWHQAIAILKDFRGSLIKRRSRSSGDDSTVQKIFDSYQEEILFLLHHGAGQEFVAQRYCIPLSKLSAWLARQR